MHTKLCQLSRGRLTAPPLTTHSLWLNFNHSTTQPLNMDVLPSRLFFTVSTLRKDYRIVCKRTYTDIRHGVASTMSWLPVSEGLFRGASRWVTGWAETLRWFLDWV